MGANALNRTILVIVFPILLWEVTFTKRKFKVELADWLECWKTGR